MDASALVVSWILCLASRDAVEESARSWATNLVVNYKCKIFHNATYAYGQNLANGTLNYNDTGTVWAWVEEYAQYKYALFDINQGAGCLADSWEKCAHYTQVRHNGRVNSAEPQFVLCSRGECGRGRGSAMQSHPFEVITDG